MTYLVMECHPAYAIVLDQAGRMIRVANMGYEEGQRVDDVIEERSTSPAVSVRSRLASAAIAACLCIAVLGGGSYGAFFVSYGTVRIQINPDVMMSVSYMDRVVGLEGLNEDGARLIDQVSYKGKNAEEMTGILVDRAVEMGYLSDGGTVTVRADAGSRQWKQKRETGISSGLIKQLEGRMAVEIRAGEDDEPADGDETKKGSSSNAAVKPSAAKPASGQIPALPDQDDSEEEKGRDSDDDDDDRDRDDKDDDDKDDRDDKDDDDKDDRDDKDDGDKDDRDDKDDDDRDGQNEKDDDDKDDQDDNINDDDRDDRDNDQGGDGRENRRDDRDDDQDGDDRDDQEDEDRNDDDNDDSPGLPAAASYGGPSVHTAANQEKPSSRGDIDDRDEDDEDDDHLEQEDDEEDHDEEDD